MRRRYKIKKAVEMETYFVSFLDTWVSFARQGKAVALQYHQHNICGGFTRGFTLVHAFSVDEHKHKPGKNTLL